MAIRISISRLLTHMARCLCAANLKGMLHRTLVTLAVVVAVGLMRGLDLQTINRHASRVAAYVCSQSGATPDMPEQFSKF